MRRRCDVNRSFGLGFDCVPSFSSGEAQQTGEGSSRSSEASRREALTGYLPVCIIRRETKADELGRNEPTKLETVLRNELRGCLLRESVLDW